MRFKTTIGNIPGTPEYREPVTLIEGRDFTISNNRVHLTKDGGETVGIALFNDRWFWDDYQFKRAGGQTVQVDFFTREVTDSG